MKCQMIGILLLVCGCASVDRYYCPVSTGGQEVVDYEGDLYAEMICEKSETDLLKARTAEGYVLVGRADFTVPSKEHWVGAMVAKGEEIKAGKVDYRTWYARTATETGIASVPTVNASLSTEWGPGGLPPTAAPTTENMVVPYNYNVDYNEYHVYYFKKRK